MAELSCTLSQAFMLAGGNGWDVKGRALGLSRACVKKFLFFSAHPRRSCSD